MTHNQALILSFTEIHASDIPLVGGKGANLGELTHAGFPIPTGFCLTTTAFQQFVDAYPQMSKLYDLLDTITSDNVEKAREVGQHVRQTLQDVAIPSDIADAIKQHWQAIGETEAYAVRSSATAEDLPGASFAGQQDTYLNIMGEVALLNAIQRCWISLFTDRAILYRCRNGFSHRQVQLSVVVQQMIMSEKSGILFTADPLTGHRHTLAIDASYGLGEALVSGLVTPDTYRVDKRNNMIIDRQVSDKQIAIFPEKDGGTRRENLSESQRKQTVLDDEQILNLTNMGKQVEAHYGSPQDIEWAMRNDQIYLLQARPITSLYPIDGLQSPDDSLHIYFSVGHQQNMTNAMSPMGLSVIRGVLPGGRDNEIGSPYVHVDGDRLFLDVTPLLHNRILRKGVMNGTAQFDVLAPQALKIAMQRPEFQHAQGISFSFAAIRSILHMLYRIQAALWWQDLTGFAHKVDKRIAEHVQDVKSEIDKTPPGEANIRTIIHIIKSLVYVVLYWAPHFAAGEAAKRLLGHVTPDGVEEADIEAVSTGLTGNVVVEMNLALGDLADSARRSPQLCALFQSLGNDSQAWLAQASKVEDSGTFMQAWEAFLEKYGARGPSELDIMTPRWYEEPLPLLQVIANYLHKEKGSHRAQHQQLVNERNTAVERIITQSKQGILGWIRSRLVRRMIHVIIEAGVLREHHKFLAVQVLRVIKESLKQIAMSLTDNHTLRQPDDIWFLSLSDLLTLYHGGTLDVDTLVTTRQSDFKRFQKLSPPLVITSDGETPVVKFQMDDVPDGALIGNPVSAGIAEGTIHVIHNPQTETLKPGEILVAPFTDPGWTPLFINAGGLIMEVGGTMTHGSVVAREYGIPAVAGVRQATTTLHTGQRVRIDGNRGIIEIL